MTSPTQHLEMAIAHLRSELATHVAQARDVCASEGDSSRSCMVERDIVEEISAALARKKRQLQDISGGGGASGNDPFGPSNPYAPGGGGLYGPNHQQR